LPSGELLALFVGAAPADAVWAATVAFMLAPLTWSVGRSLRRGDIGVDAVFFRHLFWQRLMGLSWCSRRSI
jgi:hypothetical protein